MAKQSVGEQLNRAVDTIFAPPYRVPPRAPANLATLAHVAVELRGLPRDEFRACLKLDLQRRSKMASKPQAVPETRQTATAYLCVHDAAAAIDFYKRAFSAVEVMRLNDQATKIGHAEIRIGNSLIFLSDEFPEYGALSPRSLGGSSVKINLAVDNVDSFATQALAAGATVVRPVADQFYGQRSGQFADPFGYTWIVSSRIEEVPAEEMQRRLETLSKGGEYGETQVPSVSASFIRKGFHTVTPYIIVQDAAGLIDFAKNVFRAEEIFRDIGSADGVHCEVRIGDSMLMIGGGGSGLAWKGASQPMSFHIFVPATDLVYRRALEAGASSLHEPADMPYGERGSGIRDPFGNFWYVATAFGDSFQPAGSATVQPYLHPLRAEPFMNFLKRGLGAAELLRVPSPDGVIRHAAVRIGDSILEMGEARDIYQPMPGMYYLYVPDADVLYRRALSAGAVSLSEPSDMPYGDRVGTVKDVFGITWCLATHIARRK